MTSTPPSSEAAPIPQATVHTARQARIHIVWAIPAIAALIGLWIVVHDILEHGPSVTVEFTDAEGIEAGRTKVRFRNVDVGEVRRVTLARDLHTVLVTVDMAKFAEPLLRKGTRFWVVRPRLGTAGISGLGTLLSGDFIGMDVGNGRVAARQFVGLKVPPVIAGDEPGTQFVLDAKDLGSLGVGAPAYFRHVRVGQIVSTTLNEDGKGVTLQLFVESPFDRFIANDTRFWHASGVDVDFEGGNLRVRTESLATILTGGIAFETPVTTMDTQPSEAGKHFRLAATRVSAMKAADQVVETYVLYFDESLRGLSPGSVVDFHGLEIGEVEAIRVEYDRARKRFHFPVIINIYPDRIKSRYLQDSDLPPLESHELMASLIEQGLRGQLRSASLISGQLYIALDLFPKARAVVPEPLRTPMPVPTIPGNLQELQNVAINMAHKLDQLPLVKFGQDADSALLALNQVLGNANGFVGRMNSGLLPEAESTLAAAHVTLNQAGTAIGPDAALQTDLHATLTSVARAADSVRALADYLDKHPEALIRGKPAENK